VPSNLGSIDVGTLNDDGTYLTSAPVSSVNTLTGAVVLSANDLAADHTAVNYTAANANIDGHLSGIDTALASAGGGTSYTYSAITGTTTAQAWYHYSVDASGGAVTLNLPALSTLTDGDEIRVKLRDATNALTIDASSTETIDGAQTYTLDVVYQAVTLVVGSAEWEII
jgi:hypothetical protein